jgi:hypothetical protein
VSESGYLAQVMPRAASGLLHEAGIRNYYFAIHGFAPVVIDNATTETAVSASISTPFYFQQSR